MGEEEENKAREEYEKEGVKREGKGRMLGKEINYKMEKEGRCGNGRKDKHTLELSLKHILLAFY